MSNFENKLKDKKMLRAHNIHQIHISHKHPESSCNQVYKHIEIHCISDFRDNLDGIFLSEIHKLNFQYIDHTFPI